MKGFFSSNQNKQLWFSLSLFWLCYWVFGWIVATSISSWTSFLIDKITLLNLPLSLMSISWGIKLLEIAIIILIIVALISPFDLISLCFGGSLESDKKAFFSLLIMGIIAVIFLCWFEFFVRLSILFSAGILARLDLQNNKFKKKQSSLILILLAFSAFCFGLLCFYYSN